MWLSKQAKELIQRATCHFRPQSYFIHTNAPLPSVMLLMPARGHKLQPLVRRLVNQEDFLLADQLKTVKGETSSEAQTSNDAGGARFDSIYGIPFTESTSFICTTPQGTLELTQSPSNSKTVLAVILFSAVEGQKIRYMSSRDYQNIIILFKLTSVYCLYRIYFELRFSTRLQQGHSPSA